MPPKKHKKGNQNVQGKPAKRIRRPSRRIIEATSAVSETSDVHVPCAPASTSGGETINVNMDHLPSASQVIPQSSSSDRQDPSRQPRPQGQLPTDQSLQHSVGTSATGTTINFSPDVLSVQNSAFNQSSVGSVVENQCIGGLITGEQVQVSRPAAEMSIGDPIGSHVPVAIREKIWAGAYIDLPLLLKQARDLRTDPHITGELVIKNGQLVIEKQHLKPINNINTWTTAFTIFMSIYLEKFPGKAQDMLKYMHNIRLAAGRQGHLGWAKYDEQFRLKMERHPTSSWGVVDVELWVMFISPGQLQQSPSHSFDRDTWGGNNGPSYPFRNATGTRTQAQYPGPNSYGAGAGFKPRQSTSKLSRPIGNCYAFNRGSCSFNPCRFRHRCEHCGGPHPQANCPRQN